MKSIDWTYLRISLATIFLSLIVSAAIDAASWYLRDDKLSTYSLEKRRLQDNFRRYQKLTKEKSTIERYRNEFLRMQEAGVIGKEQRLSWIEAVQSTNELMKLPVFTYAIAPQQTFKRPNMKKASKIERRASPMSLSLTLLHEEDLFDVFDYLDEFAVGVYAVDSCSFSRGGGGRGKKITGGAIQANCKISWMSVNTDVKKKKRRRRRR